MRSTPSRTDRAVRVLALAVAAMALVWAANFVFMWNSDATKGWFDCGIHCTTTQKVTGGILVGGGLLLLLLVFALGVAALVVFFRRAQRD